MSRMTSLTLTGSKAPIVTARSVARVRHAVDVCLVSSSVAIFNTSLKKEATEDAVRDFNVAQACTLLNLESAREYDLLLCRLIVQCP